MNAIKDTEKEGELFYLISEGCKVIDLQYSGDL